YLPASLRIVVSDRGEGIAAEHLARLTEPFYRADPARAQTTGGLGLGLYLCHTIVQAHGGSLTIDSELQQGTQVRVELPLAS
ncbi:MAG: two-component system phosphate regulon sensor histidine kinase PhoR, partial [Gammaproteobacteria bacterium]